VLQRATGRPVRWKFDLGTKTWLDGSNEPGRIDVHINLPNASYPKVSPLYVFLVVLLANKASMNGLHLRPKYDIRVKLQ
jgi:hypothetical protein